MTLLLILSDHANQATLLRHIVSRDYLRMMDLLFQKND